jgi:hypothetical protein
VVVRCYIVPQAGTGTSQADAFRPAHLIEAFGFSTLPEAMPALHAAGAAALNWHGGLQDCYLLRVDVTGAQHTAIANGSGTLAAPADLSTTIANNAVRNTVRTALEDRGIPAHWVDTGATYRSVLRGVACIMLLAQRLRRGNGRILPQGITLESTIGDLTLAQRNALGAACESLGWDTSAVTLATTIRAFIRGVSQQHPRIIHLGATTLEP